MSQRLSIDGPAGTLEARLTEPAGDRIAVLCHPHPLHGGSMDDRVLGILADALSAAEISTLRFNFRGVGASGGQHDGKGGEVEDLMAVIDWIHHQHPHAEVSLAGYSFGASTVCQLLATDEAPTVDRVLLVAPPVGNLPTPPPDGSVRMDVFVGDADPFVDQAALAAWGQAASVHMLPGADHFFGNHTRDLRSEIGATLR